jgi:hypothetical protein
MLVEFDKSTVTSQTCDSLNWFGRICDISTGRMRPPFDTGQYIFRSHVLYNDVNASIRRGQQNNYRSHETQIAIGSRRRKLGTLRSNPAKLRRSC